MDGMINVLQKKQNSSTALLPNWIQKKGIPDRYMITTLHNMIIYIYVYIPGTQMTSIFEGQPLKTRPFPTKRRVIWVPGIYIIPPKTRHPTCSYLNPIP